MCKLTRLVLTCLLMLAISVQGFASTAMLFCAPSHHSTVALLVGDLPNIKHHVDQPVPASHQHDDQAQDSSALQDDGLSGDHAGTAKIGKAGTGKCSACATCCTGSCIVSTQSFNPVEMTGSELIPFIQESFINYTPEGLDPPPKSVLA